MVQHAQMNLLKIERNDEKTLKARIIKNRAIIDLRISHFLVYYINMKIKQTKAKLLPPIGEILP